MSYIKYNPNPKKAQVGDCVIRALTLALDLDWERAYVKLVVHGFKKADMPSANHVWGSLLLENGFKRYALPNTCPDCYTIKDFCKDYPVGLYVVATGTHTLTVINGNYYDSWDSGEQVPIYFFTKEV